MKLVLANNQSERFVAFYRDLAAQSPVPFEYTGYTSLLFVFDSQAEQSVQVLNTASGKRLTDYDGVYINSYLRCYELAATVAICCDAVGVGYQNKELANPPSLSKLTMYAKLAAADVSVPYTLAGTKQAILQAATHVNALQFPAVLKRADADRGIDNYKVKSFDDIAKLLEPHHKNSMWLLQEFVPNQGYYLLTFYGNKPAFCIHRTLQPRTDGNEHKAHMYKPVGGANASLVALDDVASGMVDECARAIKAMNRQIASVDCIYDSASGRTYVLEVNYNPQFATIETFKDVRIEAFLSHLKDVR